MATAAQPHATTKKPQNLLDIVSSRQNDNHVSSIRRRGSLSKNYSHLSPAYSGGGGGNKAAEGRTDPSRL